MEAALPQSLWSKPRMLTETIGSPGVSSSRCMQALLTTTCSGTRLFTRLPRQNLLPQKEVPSPDYDVTLTASSSLSAQCCTTSGPSLAIPKPNFTFSPQGQAHNSTCELCGGRALCLPLLKIHF